MIRPCNLGALLLLSALAKSSARIDILPFSLSSYARSCFGEIECIEYSDFEPETLRPPVVPLASLLELIEKHADVVVDPMRDASLWPVDDFDSVDWMLRHIISAGLGYSDGLARFSPFVQKVVVPAGAQVAMFGDLHGSVHSFIRELMWMQVGLKPGYA